MAKEELKGGLTSQQIEALKKKHKAKVIHLISVKTEDGEELFFWFKKVDMTTMSAVGSFAETDPIKAAQVMFKNCLISGEVSYADDVEVFLAISEHLNVLMSKAQSKLEKF